jgi:hypothetical protein
MRLALLLFVLLSSSFSALSQELYTGKGYWEEANKENFRIIKQKQSNGDSLTLNEKAYLQDYSAYLATYYQRMSDFEKQRYESLNSMWDQELATKVAVVPEEFEWRGRDRFLNTLCGVYYGASFVAITGIENAAAVGVPLITGGLWLLGPAIIPKKYEGINQSVVRASNSGKFLGLFYGASLALTVAGQSEDLDKWVLGLSSVGSIALGEIGFQLQKKKPVTDGHIEIMRHYGFLGPWVGLSAALATKTENPNLVGGMLLGGAASGLLLGNHVAKKYDYTRGDVDVINSLAWISTGLGFTTTIEAMNNNDDVNALILIPAAGSVIGTLLAQKAVKGARFTKKQGSTIGLATAGAALMGAGIVALADETDSPALLIGIPSAMALITHQILFHNFKKDNLELKLQGSVNRKKIFHASLNVTPESYLLNKKIPLGNLSPAKYASLQNPFVKLKITF